MGLGVLMGFVADPAPVDPALIRAVNVQPTVAPGDEFQSFKNDRQISPLVEASLSKLDANGPTHFLPDPQHFVADSGDETHFHADPIASTDPSMLDNFKSMGSKALDFAVHGVGAIPGLPRWAALNKPIDEDLSDASQNAGEAVQAVRGAGIGLASGMAQEGSLLSTLTN